MKVSAIVVSHGSAQELAEALPELEPQVDELLVIANVPGSVPSGVEAYENPHPLGFAANVNLGVRLTSGEAIVVANPDAIARPGAVAALRSFMAEHPRCGVAGPAMVFPDGRASTVAAPLPDGERHARQAHAASSRDRAASPPVPRRAPAR